MIRILGVILLVWVWALPLYAQDSAYAQALNSYYKGHYAEALVHLNAVPDGKYDTKPILKSMIYLSEHRPDQAALALAGTPQTGEISDYAHYIELLISLEKADLTRGQALLTEEWLFTNPFLMRKARLDVAQSLYDKGHFKESAEMATQLLTYHSDPVITPKAMRLLLLIDLETRDRTATLKRYGALVSQFPGEDPNLDLFRNIQKILGVRSSLAECFDSPKAYLSYIKNLFDVKNYVLLVNQASQFIAQFPRDPKIGEAYFYHGLGTYHLTNYRAAIVSFERAVIRDANVKNHPQYYYYAAHSALMLQDKKAVIYLTALVQRYPKNAYIPWAYYWLCRYELQLGDYKQYVKYYSAFEKKYANSPQFEQFQWEQKWIKLRKMAASESKNEDLKLSFDQLIDQSIVSAKLVKYYAYSGRSVREGIIQYPIPFQTLEWFRGMFSEAEVFPEKLLNLQSKVERLYMMGLGQLAAQEVEFYSSQDPLVFRGVNLKYLYGTLLAKLRGDLHPDSTALPEWRADPVQFMKVQVPRFLLRLFYPKAYWDTVSTYSRLYGVDPYLMMAVIREESSFDPYAESRTQAKGLMQLMPKTGKDVSFRLGIRWVGEDSLYDPELNIRLGIFYFAWLRKQIKGPAYFSVAAYNAGPDVSYQWTKRPGAASSMEQFVLSIPYPETQGYVRRVMNSYMIYRMLYAD